MSVTQVRWMRSGSGEDDRTLSHAARQLARYVERMTGDEWDVGPTREVGPAAGTAWLGVCNTMPEPPTGPMAPAPWDDGFAVWAQDGGLFIVGRNARSVLFGVYAFLERQGVRYVRPGRSGEVVPEREEIDLPEEPLVEEPRYRHRGLCIEGAPSVKHALGMVDWAAKKRMNTIFLQFFSSQYFYNRWYEHSYNPLYRGHPISEAQALTLDERVIAAMKRRGLVFHRVGHSWTSAAFDMPRSGWVKADDAEVPEQYRRFLAEVNGERKLFQGIPINTELCYSHQPALDRFVDNVVRYAEEHPELDVVHVWLSDAPNNKCECENCRPLTISDWYARIINALSEKLAERAPDTRFVFLCYFELLWPPEQVEIDESRGNAIMMFAPISRCYGHALPDPDCDDGQEWTRPPLNQFSASRNNAYFIQRLADWRKAFQGDSFDFDYHLMWANWQQLTDTGIARIYYQDLQKLKDLGLDGIISCQSFRNFYPSGLAMTVLADALWNPDVAWEELRRGYLEAAFGPHADLADAYLSRTEEMLATEDPHRRQPPFSHCGGPALVEAESYLRGVLEDLTDRRKAEPDRVYRRSLELLSHHAQFLLHLVGAYQVRAAGKPALSNLELDRAADFLRRTEARVSPYLDTELALRCSVEPHRVE
ncbi:MAG: DUF4838 domain-containing protein [Anaerolineae bacterium]|nr:DUF4838 domain-containing protein [Anaerolineae bacterium]